MRISRPACGSGKSNEARNTPLELPPFWKQLLVWIFDFIRENGGINVVVCLNIKTQRSDNTDTMNKKTHIAAGLCGFVLLSGFAHAADPKIKLRKEGNMREVLVDLTPESIKLDTLTFARPEDMRKGIAIKDFTLTPVE
jgi:hypothetical protein